ncbi:YbbR-like domain-containing protein [Bacillus lacus]|uniref:YbbR-like domain-containing protein n=1 Tax=Metabacillus lacus TaxID=1983721 RepID=A0A7X2IYU1_9BACI|nr:YbbR-like domain-containing protein [Metabacillus lacus]MRX72149.1 YbbR-like domain-containing protein [Metabacillus lacus]
MDRLMNNHWFMKITALFIALMLYMSINFDNSPPATQPGSSAGFLTPANPSVFPRATTEAATITEVPLRSYFDQENMVVTGVPETVTVTVEGPTSSVTRARQIRDFEVFAELSNLSAGTHRVELAHKNIPADLKVTVDPSIITVTVQEKISRDFPIEVDFINKNQIKDGYTPEQPIIRPNIVRVTGAREIVDSIAMIKARVSLQNRDEAFEEDSRVTVYDADGNILPVDVEPSVVRISVPIAAPSKKVPINITREGQLPEGVSIAGLETDPSEITLYGPKNVLDSLEFYNGIKLDLSKITEDTVMEVEVPLPNGVSRVSPEKLQVKINVDKVEEKVLEDLPVKPVGLADDRDIEFLDPVTEAINLNLMGSPKLLEEIEASDVELFVNVTDLDDGEHDVKVEVTGPQNVNWSLAKDTVKIKISTPEATSDS